MVKRSKPLGPPVTVAFSELCALLGKPSNDAAIAAVLARVGAVDVDDEVASAPRAGFELFFDEPTETKPRTNPKPKPLLSAIQLYREGGGFHAFTDLPEGFSFTTRSALLAQRPKPLAPTSVADRYADTWSVKGLTLKAYFEGDDVSVLRIEAPEGALGGRDVSTHPLHSEAAPTDAPADAEFVGMALLLAWANLRFGLPPRHAGTALGQQLSDRSITPVAFLAAACASTPTTLDVDPAVRDFLYGYTHRLFISSDEDGSRKKADAAITKLLRLTRRDERAYPDDFLGTFDRVVESPYYVPGNWVAFERLAPVLDARFADFSATRFLSAPDLRRYEEAAKRRDAVGIEPARVDRTTPTADASLATDLVALVGRPLTHKAVKAVLARAGLPVGKRIDEHANPALGVSYLGARFDISRQRQLGVEAVSFYAAKQRHFIRGLGRKVEFLEYPGPLPWGLSFQATRAAVRSALGRPKDSGETTDWWAPSQARVIRCEFADGKLVWLRIGRPDDE